MSKNVLIVIPARGGSKGIPRKNLRLLNGKPLIYYSIKNALNVKINGFVDVYVSSEDSEIDLLTKKFGAKVHLRDEKLADDKSTLDPVIYDCLMHAENIESKKYDLVVTMQPTSPLLSYRVLEDELNKMILDLSIDTILSATNDTHLTWKKEEGKFRPNYKERLNRQYLEPIFKETGGFLITRRNVISSTNRIGKNVDLCLLSNGQDIDIDNYNDWNLCEYILKKKKILIVVAGNETIGLGHVYNTLILANDILNHDIEFLVKSDSDLAYRKIASNNYKVYKQNNENILIDIFELNPDVVINDILDTEREYVEKIISKGIKCVNFEDLGEGTRFANLVINAIYPEKEVLNNHYFGEKYFILRDEFIFNYSNKVINEVKKVLITFGGVDPCNLTEICLSYIYDYCVSENIEINIVTGPGYAKYDSIEKYTLAIVHKNVMNISDFMYDADLIFTSAGRTVYEIASIGTPTIVMAQNERELTHFFASNENGFINLGLGISSNKESFLSVFKELISSKEKRIVLNQRMLSKNLKLGRKRVNNLIVNLINSI